jgi:hypothetical protein
MTIAATTMTMETKATAAAAAWREHGVGGGGSAAAVLAAAARQRQRGGGCAAAAAVVAGQRLKDASGDALEGQAGGGVAVLVELGRGVPRRVPQAVNVGRRAEGRESKGKDEGEGDVNGNGGLNGDKGEEGDDVGAIPFCTPERPSPPPLLSLLLGLTKNSYNLSFQTVSLWGLLYVTILKIYIS